MKYLPSITERTTECFIGKNPDRDALEGALRNIAHKLAEMRGELHTSDPGTSIMRLPLGESEVDVEYEYEAGEEEITSGPADNWHPGTPEDVTLLGVFVNGMWTQAELFAEDVRESWRLEILERLHDEWEGERAEYESMRRDERTYG